jgi:hypothetical protein
LSDPTIPMWVIKVKGETYYVDHVEFYFEKSTFSTKETPNNPSTKGSLKFKGQVYFHDKDGDKWATIYG